GPVARILLAIRGAMRPPKMRAGDLPPRGRRIRNRRQDLLVPRGNSEEKSLEAIIAFAIRERHVASPAVISNCGFAYRIGGPECGSVRKVPIRIASDEHRRIRAPRYQYGRAGVVRGIEWVR